MVQQDIDWLDFSAPQHPQFNVTEGYRTFLPQQFSLMLRVWCRRSATIHLTAISASRVDRNNYPRDGTLLY